MSEFAPIGGKPKMSKAQVKKYISDMEEKRKLAQKKLEEARLKWELDNHDEILELEKELENL